MNEAPQPQEAPRSRPRIDILPAIDRRREAILDMLDEVRASVTRGETTDLFLVFGTESGFDLIGVWRKRVELIGVLAVAQRDVIELHEENGK